MGALTTALHRDRSTRTVMGFLWALAVLGTGCYCWHRFQQTVAVLPKNALGAGGDFWGYVSAGRDVAAGHSPYHFAEIARGVGYVYSPWLALLMAPVSHLSIRVLWDLWTGASILAAAAACLMVVAPRRAELVGWRGPVLVGGALASTLVFTETKSEWFNGQSDTLILVALAAALALWRCGAPGRAGGLIGVVGLLKTWPAACAVGVLGRRARSSGDVGRTPLVRCFSALLPVCATGPALALVLGGWNELHTWVRMTLAARSQPIPSYSVWGIPKEMFSSTVFAHPIAKAAVLQGGLTLALLAFVVAVLVVNARSVSDPALRFWNATAGVVLLLPASHDIYFVYLLPMLWLWGARVARSRTWSSMETVALVVLVGWWASVEVLLPFDTATTMQRDAAAFLSNLAAFTCSVFVARLVTAAEPEATLAPLLDEAAGQVAPAGSRVAG